LIKRFIKVSDMPKRKSRISDVAKLARVSPATVSVVLNDQVGKSVRVSPETVQRVRQAALQLGYVASPLARRLAGGRNQILGIFTYEAVFPIESRNFYYPFLVGIEEEAQQTEYDLLLFTSSITPDGNRSVFRGQINRLQLADGAIFLGLGEDKRELAALRDEGFPFVYIGRREVPGGEISYVAADYTSATAEVVAYILQNGHQKVGYLRSHLGREAHVDRLSGYILALEDSGLPFEQDLIWSLERDEIDPRRVAAWLGQGITAFVTENNSLGFALLQSARELGKRPPDDFSMAVLGDPLVPNENLPDWTMFRIPRRAMGAQAVQLLVKILDDAENFNHDPYQVTLSCAFEPGATVAGPP
jgi:DNA-binding LacI/PurR family transcriptional regulator